jgi:hypothetical protein
MVQKATTLKDLNTLNELNSIPKPKRFALADALFYIGMVLLVVSMLCYIIFSYKITALNQRISGLDQQLLAYGSPQQRVSEKQVFAYKKELDDFSGLINNHRLTSNLFDFLEKKTLPNVWIISMNLAETKNQVNILGEANTMDTLSRQIKILEDSKDYIASIEVLNSQVTKENKARFTLNLTLNSSIFSQNYKNASLTAAPTP